MSDSRIIISSRAFASINIEINRFQGVETGGVLLGKFCKDWLVAENINPGYNAYHNEATFEYDSDYVEYEANNLSKIYKDDMSILGLWHTHVHSSPFSYADEDMNRKFCDLNPFGAISGIFDVEKQYFKFYMIDLFGTLKEIKYIVRDIKFEINI